MVREARKRANEESTSSIVENCKEIKTKFWKRVKEVTKGDSLRFSPVRNSMGEELTRENDVEVRWKKYFVWVLNGDKINEVGGDDRGTERVVRKVVREEIIGGLKKIKEGKAAGMDIIVVEMLKN